MAIHPPDAPQGPLPRALSLRIVNILGKDVGAPGSKFHGESDSAFGMARFQPKEAQIRPLGGGLGGCLQTFSEDPQFYGERP